MKKSFILFIITLINCLLLLSCESNPSSSQTKVEDDTASSSVQNKSDLSTTSSSEIATGGLQFSNLISAQVCNISWTAKDLLDRLDRRRTTYVAFEFLGKNTPLQLTGELLDTDSADGIPYAKITLTCVNPRTPRIVYADGEQDYWLRRLYLPVKEIKEYFMNISSTDDFKDLMGNSRNYKILVRPDTSSDKIGVYISGALSVLNISKNVESKNTVLHPCPYCEAVKLKEFLK